jgi:hypothetical protein
VPVQACTGVALPLPLLLTKRKLKYNSDEDSKFGYNKFILMSGGGGEETNGRPVLVVEGDISLTDRSIKYLKTIFKILFLPQTNTLHFHKLLRPIV